MSDSKDKILIPKNSLRPVTTVITNKSHHFTQ